MISKLKGNVKTTQIMVQAAETAALNMARFKKGDRVNASRPGSLAVMQGIVTRVRRNGTYDIHFEDGVHGSNIPKQNVREIEEKVDRTAFGVTR